MYKLIPSLRVLEICWSWCMCISKMFFKKLTICCWWYGMGDNDGDGWWAWMVNGDGWSGIAADVLLWRKKHLSVGTIAGAFIIWLLFEWIGYHFVSVISFFLLMGIVLLFIWSYVADLLNRSLSHSYLIVCTANRIVHEYTSWDPAGCTLKSNSSGHSQNSRASTLHINYLKYVSAWFHCLHILNF